MPSAEVSLFTFKEGLLSAMAHDLELRADGQLTLGADGAVWFTLEPRALHVLHAVRDGRAAPGLLSHRDKETIQATLRREVLQGRTIVYTARAVPNGADELRLEGSLEIAGRTQPHTLTARRAGEVWRAETRLDQRHFGIRPYTAMLGTLRVRPEVRLTVLVMP